MRLGCRGARRGRLLRASREQTALPRVRSKHGEVSPDQFKSLQGCARYPAQSGGRMGGRRRHDFGTLRRFKKRGKPRRLLVRIRGRSGRDPVLELGPDAEASGTFAGGGFRSGQMGERGSGVCLRVAKSTRRSVREFLARTREGDRSVRGGPRPTLVCGDFNAKHVSWSGYANNARGRLLKEWFDSRRFVVRNKRGAKLVCGPPSNP